MAHKVESGFWNMVSGFTLNTVRPVTPDLFEEALMHLQKWERENVCVEIREWSGKMLYYKRRKEKSFIDDELDSVHKNMYRFMYY